MSQYARASKYKKGSVMSQASWEKSSAYREAILIKVLRAMKNYGYQDWMADELKRIGYSL